MKIISKSQSMFAALAITLPLVTFYTWPATAEEGVAAGAATGAIGGAIVGGPVGAAVGAAGGAVVGGIIESQRPAFREYVVREHRPSYRWDGDVSVGVVLPRTGVTYYEVPARYGKGYRYTVVNGQTVIVDPATRRVIQIVN